MNKNIDKIITILENKKLNGIKNVFVSPQNLQKLKNYLTPPPAAPNHKTPEATTPKDSEKISTPKIAPQKPIKNNLQQQKLPFFSLSK